MNRPDPIPFDTHRFVKRLTKEGMPAGQAEVLADEQITLLNANLATKQDLGNVATKDDLSNCATKGDLSNFATKDDLSNFATKDDLSNFATKDDLSNFATKDDLSNFATKDDLPEFPRNRDWLTGLSVPGRSCCVATTWVLSMWTASAARE